MLLAEVLTCHPEDEREPAGLPDGTSAPTRREKRGSHLERGNPVVPLDHAPKRTGPTIPDRCEALSRVRLRRRRGAARG